jgi:hypothetical protein
MAALPETAPADAEIVACPAATPVTRPLASTVATVGAFELQVMADERVAPVAETARAARATEPPRSMVAAPGVTWT